MDIRASEISAILKQQIANFGDEAEVAEVGQVLSVGAGIARSPDQIGDDRQIGLDIAQRVGLDAGGAEGAHPGVPWPVYFLLAPINLLELLIIRPASLTIRLFANMVSGHLMVATCLAFAPFWMVDAVNKLQGIPVGALWFAGGFAMTCFEAFVAFLQAYVFAILSTVYINLSFPEE